MSLTKKIQQIVFDRLTELKNKILAQQANGKRGKLMQSLSVEPTATGAVLVSNGLMTELNDRGSQPENLYELVQKAIKEDAIPVQPIEYKRQATEKWQAMYSPAERGERSLAWYISQEIENEGASLYQSGANMTLGVDNSEIMNKIEEEISNLIIEEI